MTLSKQLDALEQRFAELLSVVENLEAENKALRSREQKLQTECLSLRKKNEVATAQLETMLERLKAAASAAHSSQEGTMTHGK